MLKRGKENAYIGLELDISMNVILYQRIYFIAGYNERT